MDQSGCSELLSWSVTTSKPFYIFLIFTLVLIFICLHTLYESNLASGRSIENVVVLLV